MPVAYLLHPAVQGLTWWMYHPDSLAITPLVFAWWLARTARWRWFAVACAVALSCKEDMALAVLVMGLVIVARGRLFPLSRVGRAQRRAGLSAAAAAAAWFLFTSKVVIPEVTVAGRAV